MWGNLSQIEIKSSSGLINHQFMCSTLWPFKLKKNRVERKNKSIYRELHELKITFQLQVALIFSTSVFINLNPIFSISRTIEAVTNVLKKLGKFFLLNCFALISRRLFIAGKKKIVIWKFTSDWLKHCKLVKLYNGMKWTALWWAMRPSWVENFFWQWTHGMLRKKNLVNFWVKFLVRFLTFSHSTCCCACTSSDACWEYWNP